MRWRDVPPLGEDIPSNNHVPSLINSPPKSHYFKWVLLTGYYTLAVPYKPILDKSTGKYTLQEHPLQKYLCYTSWTLSIINRITQCRLNLQKTYSTPSVIIYFQTCHSLLHVLSYIMFFYTITFSSSSIVKLLNSINSSSLITRNSFRNKFLKILQLTSQLIWLCLWATSPIVGYEVLNTCCWSPKNLLSGYVSHSHYTFFIQDNISPVLPEVNAHSSIDVFTGLAQMIITFSHVTLLFFIVCLFGNCSITLWANASGFCDVVMGSKDVEKGNEGVNLIRTFEEFCDLATSINYSWHLLAFWYMIDLTAWLSTELDTGLRTPDYFVKVHIFYYLGYICVALCFSAEAFRKIDKLKSHYRNHDNAYTLVNTTNTKESVDQVFKCLKTCVSGIGEVGFFRINYSFIGQLTGLIITFYIISVERHTSQEEMMMSGDCGECVVH